MKKVILMSLVSLILILNPVWASERSQAFSRGTVFLTGQIGLNAASRTFDPLAEPINAFPFTVGINLETMLTNHIGVGGSILYDQWSDYLGMFGGRWTFRLIKPSFDIAYHFRARGVRGLDLCTGTNLGYSIVSVSNIFGRSYEGNLKSEPHLAPFIGANVHFWPNSPDFPGRLSVSFRVAWSATGRLADVYGLAGLTLRLR